MLRAEGWPSSFAAINCSSRRFCLPAVAFTRPVRSTLSRQSRSMASSAEDGWGCDVSRVATRFIRVVLIQFPDP
jgi:hypothetical protein